jgi:hypothetical protein
VTPRGGATVVVPIGIAYYLLWRYGVLWLNSVVKLDAAEEEAPGGSREH